MRAARRAQSVHQDSRARPKASRRSRSRSSPACRSTSRCCSRASSTSPPPRRTCAASSGASPPASIRRSRRSRRCSSAAGTWRSRTRCRRQLRNRLGIAIAKRTYKAYRELLASPRWQKLAAAGARPQRLLWASTGTKDPDASDTLYVEALAAPDTINTMPEKTLLAFADHGESNGAMPADGGDAEASARRVRAGRRRRRRARRPAAARRRRSLRQVVERAAATASPPRATQLEQASSTRERHDDELDAQADR